MSCNAIQTEALSGPAGPARLAKLQSERLETLLRASLATPACRQLLAGRELAALQLTDLPVSNKSQLMHAFEQHLADPQLKRSDLQAFCRDPQRVAEHYLGRYTVWESSGSSGEPGLYIQDSAAMAVYESLEATRRHTPRPWLRLWDPFYLSERFAFVGAIDGHFASHVSVQRLRRSQPWLTRQWRSFSILQPLPELIRQLNTFSPTIIASYPTAALLLAQAFERGDLRCRPQEIWTGGETLSGPSRKRIEAAFGCPLRNSYGASEFLPLAWECEQGQLHLNADWAILEPVDAQYRPAPQGQASHTTLLTNLANHVQPLIRFDIGDSITLPATRCACGSALPVVQVQGRRDDILRLPASEGGTVALLPLALTTVLEDAAGLFDFQLKQTLSGRLHLTLGASADNSRVARERCLQVLHRFVKEQGGADPTISIHIGKNFELGHSGKHKRILAAAAA